ncbi:cysteine desulfurase family protein [Rhodoferax ferrireducens]|uniref:cysteine desulfurase family protein n=1 Tax=Rhodoferax ferrireducens TaxID=192843 RepID=UPI00298E021C|nr:cysteine desulfurase family protein [Rhodoferax ferrireducens]WPC67558.1 cysteine desulfurase family protein [Rhodoferax ferrireducens]
MTDPIYLDYNATTPVAPEVLDAMLPWLREQFGNPSSTHAYGRRAAQAVATARRQVADLIGAKPHEIVFTGCATESNNLALLGTARSMIETGSAKRHIVISAVEHPAVLAPAIQLRAQGWDVTVLPVDALGRVSAEQVAKVLRDDTALVSIMHANNEVGTLQPIPEIAAVTSQRGIHLHTDAAQSAGKVPLNVDALGVDLLTLAGHKFYAPKGIGALYVREGTPILAVLHGADQEHGLRPGTENVAAIVALGAAAALVNASLETMAAHMLILRDQLHQALIAAIPGLQLNGHPEQRLPNTLHVSFPGVSGRLLLAEVADVLAASVGSACHSEHDAVSGVLAAMGVDATRAAGAVRLSVGRMTTSDEIHRAAKSLATAWQSLLAR